MVRSRSHLALSALGWIGFVVVAVWTALFLADALLAHTVSGVARLPAATAVAVDAALIMLFAAQHSAMARQAVKAWLARWVPPPLERTCYVLAADASLALLLALWQPWGGRLWRIDGPGAIAVWAVYLAGWLLAILATFAVDHLELFGLRQAGWGGTPSGAAPALVTGGMHAVVRHPLMAGLLLAFWATPRMSASHLMLAVAMTGYIAVGIAFEERDLRRRFGAAYREYARRVPAVVPGLHLVLHPARRSAGATGR